MRMLLRQLHRRTPGWLISAQIQILLAATARAFEREAERVWHLPPGKALERYARFSVECINGTEISAATLRRLYRQAWILGERVRKLTGFTRQEDLRDLVFFLYRNIGIAMSGSLPGEIAVSSCYFSRLYTPRECTVMSRMDSGVTGGIFGEYVKHGRLVFSGRLTEGCTCCRAVFR